jgi:hypothetical protein
MFGYNSESNILLFSSDCIQSEGIFTFIQLSLEVTLQLVICLTQLKFVELTYCNIQKLFIH